MTFGKAQEVLCSKYQTPVFEVDVEVRYISSTSPCFVQPRSGGPLPQAGTSESFTGGRPKKEDGEPGLVRSAAVSKTERELA